jgi:hypothetical protein
MGVQMTLGERLLILFAMLAFPLVVIGVPIFVLMGGPKKFAMRPLERCFSGLELHDTPQPGDVSCVYHSYRGLFVYFVQTEHQIYAPPSQAKELLKRLLRFNLTWGMLSYGLLFIPFIAIANYYSQKSLINVQESDLKTGIPAEALNTKNSP